MQSRIIYFLGIFIITVLGCKNDAAQIDATLHIRIKKDPERLNPLLLPSSAAREIYQYMHLSLADFNPKTYEYEPIMIEKIPTAVPIDTGKYAGGIYYDIELKEGMFWNNGQPITFADYLFTYKTIKLPSSGANRYRELLEQIDDILPDADNPLKGKVIFTKDVLLSKEMALGIPIYPSYFYDSLQLISTYTYNEIASINPVFIPSDSILSKFVETFNDIKFSTELFSGAGPYELTDWESNRYVILKRKSKYWAGDSENAYLQSGPAKIVFHIIPDELTAVTQLKNGELDVVNELSAETFEEIQNKEEFRSKFEFYTPEILRQYYLLMNNKDELVKDKLLRKAIAHLVNVDEFIEVFEKGKATRTVGPIHPSRKTFNSDLKPIKFDPKLAKDLLSSAGWQDTDNDGVLDKVINGKKKNLVLNMLISGHELGKKLALLFQSDAAKVGIVIEITEKDNKLIRTENIKNKNYQLFPASSTQDLQLWDDLQNYHSSNDQIDGSNDAGYVNYAVDEIIDSIQNTKDESKRIELYRKFQEYIYEDQPMVYLYAPKERIIVSNNWKSYASVKRPGYMANTFQYVGVPNNK